VCGKKCVLHCSRSESQDVCTHGLNLASTSVIQPLSHSRFRYILCDTSKGKYHNLGVERIYLFCFKGLLLQGRLQTARQKRWLALYTPRAGTLNVPSVFVA
jgi:hypothetical protein